MQPIQQAAGAPAGAEFNFAYGANINNWKLKQVRQILPEQSFVGLLRGFALKFNHRGGFGNIEPADGAFVFGVCHLLTKADFDRLRQMESGYNELEVDVATKKHGLIQAKAFVSKPKSRISNGPGIPSARYINLLIRGAHEWQMHPEYIRWLENTPSVPKGVCRAFQDGCCQQGPACKFKHLSVLPHGSQARLALQQLRAGFRFCAAAAPPLQSPTLDQKGTQVAEDAFQAMRQVKEQEGGNRASAPPPPASAPPPAPTSDCADAGAATAGTPRGSRKSKPKGRRHGRRRKPTLGHLQ